MTTGNATRDQLLRSLTTAVYDNLLTRDDPDIVEEYEYKIHRSLQKYDDALLGDAIAIVGTGQAYDERAHYYDERAHNTAAMLEGGEDEKVIRAYWHFAPSLVADSNSNYAPQYLFSSLERYPKLRKYMEGRTYASEEATRQCLALMNVVLTLCNQPDHGKDSLEPVTYRYPALKDSRVADLIIDHPEYSERIIGLINSGRRPEYGYLITVLELEGGSAALSTGIL